MPGHKEIPGILAGCLEMHETKSTTYGEETFDNVSSLSKRPNFMYALDRITEKLTRAYALESNGRLDEMQGELIDMCLFAALAEAMRRDYVSDYAKEIDHPVILHAVQRPLPKGVPLPKVCTCDAEAFGAHASTCQRYA